ncbi:MAG: 2-C-methyl-D-erythritol 4-phosphate cytidylyltransferase [Planctomycetaceae bacterium]
MTTPRSTFAVILPAAGRSSRFASSVSDGLAALGLAASRKKPFQELKGRPVWLRALEPFVNRDDVVQRIVALSPEDLEWFKDKYRANLAFLELQLVEGGAERADTVARALSLVRADVEYVAVHDAARPLIAHEWIDAVFRAAEKYGAAIPATPISSTLKLVASDGRIVKTVPREGLWAAQTPQVFRRQLLLDAFAQRGDFQPTDEAQLVERLGQPVHVVECSPMNLKITSAEDLRLAEALVDHVPQPSLAKRRHPFEDERWT